MNHPSLLIKGQGIAGTCLAWTLIDREVSFKIEDRGFGGSSRVAAGLINPITGKNFEPSWLIEEFHQAAISFYQKIEKILEADLWYPLPILRLASSAKESQKIASKLSLPHVTRWLSGRAVETPEGFHSAIELAGGGRVDTAKFVKLSGRYFEKMGFHGSDSGEVPKKTFLCTGAEGLVENQLGPHRCAKGEILTIHANWPETHIRIGAGGWLVPIGNHHFRVGSTYEWNELDERPTQFGADRITEIATRLGGENFEITGHVAGVRPILRRSQPLIGQTPEGEWIFNALGSKGTLYAPKMAKFLVDWALENKKPAEHFQYQTSLE